MSNQTITAQSYSLRLSVFFGAVFLIVGTYLPFFPVWLDWKGLGATDIGIILATPLIVRVFFTPVISFLADRIGDHRLVLQVLAYGTILSLFGLFFAEGFWQVFIVSVILAMFWTTILPLSDAVAMAGMREVGISYGHSRIWGSVTFILASFGGGFLLDWYGAPLSLWLLVASTVCVIFAAYYLPKPQGKGRLKAATVGPQIKVLDGLNLMKQPLFVLFLLTTAFVQASHAVVYGFGTLHWQGQGLSTWLIGILWGVGVVAEIILFVYSRSLFERMGAAWLLLIAAVAGVVRWSITALDPPVAILFFCQALHAFTFGAGHLASVDFVSKSVPKDHTATALGLYAAFTAGIAMGLATISSGTLYKEFGGNAFFVMAALSSCGLIGAYILVRRWDQQLLPHKD